MNKLKLESAELIDAQEIFDLIEKNRQRFSEWLSWVDDISTVEDEFQFLKKSQKENRILYCIKFENEIIGMIDLHNIDYATGLAEIGYWIDEDCEGNGIISNLVANLEEYVDESQGIDSLRIKVNQENIRSINVAQRASFEFVQREEQKIVYQKVLN